MSDEELVKRLRSWAKDIQEGSTAIYAMDLDLKNAASSIEALTEQLEDARQDAKEAEAYAEELEKERDRWREIANNEAVEGEANRNAGLALETKLAKAVEALRKLHHAVCGETGFAACVRLDSGLAYPWPALDEADEMTRTTLAEIEGEKK